MHIHHMIIWKKLKKEDTSLVDFTKVNTWEMNGAGNSHHVQRKEEKMLNCEELRWQES